MVQTFTNGKINMYPQLDHGMQYRLNEINRIKTILLMKLAKEKQ